jgi:anti-sigma-K factor RskA
MTTDDREEADILAGEYVLGTLAGAERVRFEARLAAEPALQALVDGWTRRLSPLADALTPVEPPPELWSRIQARITPHAPDPAAREPMWMKLGFWRWSAIGGALATAALALFIAFAPTRLGDADHIVVLNDAQAKPAVIVVANVRTNTVAVKQVAAAPPPGRVYQLWLLPGANQAPRPIGLLSAAAAVPHPMPDGVKDALPRAAGLAVSVEPPGGSPTGLPTGPVVYHGTVIALAR